MKILIESDKSWALNVIRDIVNLFFANVELVNCKEKDIDAILWLKSQIKAKNVTAEAVFSFANESHKPQSVAIHRKVEEDELNHEKRLVKSTTYQLLTKVLEKNPGPWGILTGIRPTKIVHRWWDKGFDQESIKDKLRDEFLLSDDKAKLLLDITKLQRNYLPTKSETKEKVGIYIGIPFCPSKCTYCSFPSYPVNKFGHLKGDFLLALKKEIDALSGVLDQQSLDVQHIYIGGGTPTSLSLEEVKELLDQINSKLRTEKTEEFTVEAGRPDTFSEELAQILRDAKVTRISVNPQSLNQDTLRTIGREHTVEEFFRAYQLVNNMGIKTVNVDLIVGLPGEGPEELSRTLEQLRELKIHNLTIHPLALKRASRILTEGLMEQRSLHDSEQANIMFKLANEFVADSGLRPYYMYRQKRIFGNHENIGFSLPGHECLYNIQMIEERQTIIGLGCGAGSKFVNPEDWTLSNVYNPKDIITYVNKVDSLLAEKMSYLTSHNK